MIDREAESQSERDYKMIESLRAALAESVKDVSDADDRCGDALARAEKAERERDEAGRLIVEINSQFESMKRTAIDHSRSHAHYMAQLALLRGEVDVQRDDAADEASQRGKAPIRRNPAQEETWEC